MNRVGEETFRSGFAAIVGRPNVGKSTLLNRLVGRKVAIVSDRPQTTRTRILGVLHRPDAQVVFLDTPGFHRPRHRLGEQMMRTLEQALHEVEVILFLVDAASETPGPGDRFVAQRLRSLETPVILGCNKIDAVSADALPPILERFQSLGDFQAVVPISALRGDHVERLVETILRFLPPGPRYFPEDMWTDQPERLIVAEFIREKILQETREEVPHAVAVQVEEMREREEGTLYVRATIYCERESQKGILIGRGGRVLKAVGTAAREDLERLFGVRFFLDLWVKVKKDWRDRLGALREFGYGEG